MNLRAEHCLPVNFEPAEVRYDVRYYETSVRHPVTRRYRRGPIKKVISVYAVIHGVHIPLGTHEEEVK